KPRRHRTRGGLRPDPLQRRALGRGRTPRPGSARAGPRAPAGETGTGRHRLPAARGHAVVETLVGLVERKVIGSGRPRRRGAWWPSRSSEPGPPRARGEPSPPGGAPRPPSASTLG